MGVGWGGGQVGWGEGRKYYYTGAGVTKCSVQEVC